MSGYRLAKTRTGFDFVDPERLRPPVPYASNWAWVDPGNKMLFLTQQLIQSERIEDPISGMDVRVLHLAHEILHVMDTQLKVSRTPAFMSAHDETLRLIDVRACQRLFELRRQDAQVDYGRAWIAARMAVRSIETTVGARRHLPFQTVCTANPMRYEEAFAEYLSYWLLDAKAPDYLPDPIGKWTMEFLSRYRAGMGR
jgi:hypothetical protein